MDESCISQCLEGYGDDSQPPVINVDTPKRNEQQMHIRTNENENTDIVEQEKGKNKNPCILCKKPENSCMIKCAECQSYAHYRCTNLPAYQIYNFSKRNRKFTCRVCSENNFELLKEESVEGTLETKNNEIDELKRRTDLQNKEIQNFRDELQKNNNRLKLQKISFKSKIEEKDQQIRKQESEVRKEKQATERLNQ